MSFKKEWETTDNVSESTLKKWRLLIKDPVSLFLFISFGDPDLYDLRVY